MTASTAYNLPKFNFVGGESHTFEFKLFAKDGIPFDLTDCIVDFSVTQYANKNGSPLFTKSATTQVGVGEVANVAVVSLVASDTVNLSGRYVYQLSVKDSIGKMEIPGQGIIDIKRNINTAFAGT